MDKPNEEQIDHAKLCSSIDNTFLKSLEKSLDIATVTLNIRLTVTTLNMLHRKAKSKNMTLDEYVTWALFRKRQ